MGAGEEASASKSSKGASSSQEIPTTPVYPDWSSHMQAYYGAGATPFFAPTLASPTPHPYLWGGQHPMMPPYGTPIPYPAMYPPGGVYAHPNMSMTPGLMPTSNNAVEGKIADGKDGDSSKKNKGTAGNAGLGVNEAGDGAKATSGSGNDVGSQSGESGSEGSSDANGDNDPARPSSQAAVSRKPVNSGPPTNLNIGMDLWSSGPVAASSAMVPGTVASGQWIQDERELKRQQRKQSNRESARRSRLRKQAECEELQVRVETLSDENRTLREELERLSEQCEKLKSDNGFIKEELTRLCRADTAVAI